MKKNFVLETIKKIPYLAMSSSSSDYVIVCPSVVRKCETFQMHSEALGDVIWPLKIITT